MSHEPFNSISSTHFVVAFVGVPIQVEKFMMLVADVLSEAWLALCAVGSCTKSGFNSWASN